MSAENVQLMRQAIESINAVGRTDPEHLDPEVIVPEVWARLDPEFELHERADLPDARVYRGPEDSKAFWRKTSELFAEVRWEPEEFIDLGHAVVIRARVVAIGRGSDIPIEADEADV